MSEEELPEADCIESALHPRRTLRLYGHDAAAQEVLTAFKSGRLHHGWLITGPPGIGKASFAWRMAHVLRTGVSAQTQTLWCDAEDPVQRRLAALSDPACLLIRRSWDREKKRHKTQISVDEIRKINRFFGLKATDGGRRVVIVDSADEMTPSAANALLKLLEEPPEHAVLILISHQPARLLPTLSSRCRRLRLGPLAPEALGAALQALGSDPMDAKSLGELAGGAPGVALRMLAEDAPALYARLLELIALAPNMDRSRARALIEGVTARGAEARLLIFRQLLDFALMRIARSAAGHPPQAEAAPGERDVFLTIAKSHPAADWAELQQRLSARLTHGFAVNVDPQNLLMDALLDLNKIARAP